MVDAEELARRSKRLTHAAAIYTATAQRNVYGLFGEERENADLDYWQAVVEYNDARRSLEELTGPPPIGQALA